MKRQVADCDRCDAKNLSAPMTVNLKVGESKDPVDCRTTPDFEPFDLCPTCAAWALYAVAGTLPGEVSENLAKRIRECKKAGK